MTNGIEFLFRGFIAHILKYAKQFFYCHFHTKWRRQSPSSKTVFFKTPPREDGFLGMYESWNKKSQKFIIYIIGVGST